MKKIKKTLKTLQVRVRDKHKDDLNRMAFDVNQVWNAANALTDEFSWVPVPEVGYMRMNVSEWDLNTELKDLRKERNLNIPAATVQEIIRKHAQARKQFKKNKLRWRCSGGSRRALGFIPIRNISVKFVNGQVRFNGMYFKVWDSYGLSKYEFVSASFSEDSRGRWYFNAVVEVVEETQQSGKGEIGIDLGLKTTAVCSNGDELPSYKFYRNSEEKLGKAQRAKKKKQVKNIHAKIKNRRKDALHKFSNKIVKENSLIVVGNVNSRGLAKTKMAKSVLDSSWGILKNMIDYKSKGMQSMFLVVNEAYSTQTCSCCGCISTNSPKGRAGLAIREWTCSDCGTTHDRDINAAKNILRMGHHTLAVGIPAL